MNKVLSIENKLMDKNEELRNEKYLNIFKDSLLTPDDSFDKPPSILTINGVDYGTLGNISMITGKAKSRKSMFLTLMTATIIKSGCVKGFENKENKDVLYFDTEQSNYHAWLQTKRLLNISNDFSRIKYSALRKHDPTTRINAIKQAIYSFNNISLVVIDGIADLMNKGVNDEEEAIKVVGKLMKWSQERNIHIITVLHQNKGDNNAKGHLGSQLTQKCETVLSIEKDEKDKTISKVESTFSRGIGIESLFISIDDLGMPFITDYSANNSVKSKYPFDYEIEVNKLIIKEVFTKSEELSYRDLQDQIKHVLAKYNIKIGDGISRQWISYFRDEEMIFQGKSKSPYKMIL